MLNKPQLFGKNGNGRQNIRNMIVLLPYLLYLWGIWHLLRLCKSENAIDQIDNNIYIGRRLLKNEFPEKIKTVVDLTCEFSENRLIVKNTDYYNFQILDASTPNPEELADFINKISQTDGPVFIHCAEGHGRTALVASLFLIAKEKAKTLNDAYEMLKTKRPLVKLNREQKRCAEETLKLLKNIM